MDANETVFEKYGSETVQIGDGESQNMFGCDGSNHAVSKDLFRPAGDEFPFGNVIEDLGACDGSCADGRADSQNRGSGFLHAAPTPKLELVSS